MPKEISVDAAGRLELRGCDYARDPVTRFILPAARVVAADRVIRARLEAFEAASQRRQQLARDGSKGLDAAIREFDRTAKRLGQALAYAGHLRPSWEGTRPETLGTNNPIEIAYKCL